MMEHIEESDSDSFKLLLFFAFAAVMTDYMWLLTAQSRYY